MFTEKEFIELIAAHQNIIHKVCNVYMNDTHDKEDLFQEITLQAWKSVKNFKAESKFSTWLYRVALNTAITFFKKEKKQSFIQHQDIKTDITDEHNGLQVQQINALYKAIGELTKIDKALVMLYLEDMNYNEISNVLGISANNIAVKMNRIKIKLKDLTTKYYETD
jgi:RNA polymerase sigma-70 factor (ECF subfamily)